jgi:hypothetical protein
MRERPGVPWVADVAAVTRYGAAVRVRLFFWPQEEGMSLPEGYIRKGVPCYFQLDHDAMAMLKELSPTQKSYGRYLSDLVRIYYIRKT